MRKDGTKANQLRDQAEKLLRGSAEEIKDLPADDTQKLIHELQVHQIELEMQNEELTHTREELEESRDRYFDLYDFAPIGYFTLDQNGLILEANLTGAGLLGVERKYLIKRAFSHYMAPESQNVFHSHRKQIFETKTRQACELKFMKKDGIQFYAQATSTIRQDRKGNFSQFRTAIMDITEHKRTRDKLAEEHARAEMYLDLLGHDINNLNAAVVLYSELLLKEINFEAKHRTYLEKSLKQTMAISQLISNVHKLSRIKGEELETEDTDLFEIVELESVKVKDSYPMRQIKINHSLSESEVMVKANELLCDVVINLLGNAVKYCRHDEVVIDISHRLSDDSKYWKIEFKDNGPGICDEMKERVFARLVREKTKSSIRGSGLGLTLVREITTGLGGKAWVEDRVKGNYTQGSNFVLLLRKGDK